MSKLCVNCSCPVESWLSYCTWDCHVQAAIKDGARVHTPNGLPIKCIKHDGTLLEHEHGDDPDYQFPVDVEYVGELTDDDRADVAMMCGRTCDDDTVRQVMGEFHAFIGLDGSVAVTLYECCVARWDLTTGRLVGGSLWKVDRWKLSDESLAKIKEKTCPS